MCKFVFYKKFHEKINNKSLLIPESLNRIKQHFIKYKFRRAHLKKQTLAIPLNNAMNILMLFIDEESQCPRMYIHEDFR